MFRDRLVQAIESLRTQIDKGVDWLRQHFHWQNVGGFVGVVAGTIGAILMAADAYLPAEICFGLSGATLVLWALTLHVAWLLRIAGAFLLVGGTWYVVATVNEARITKILEANFGVLKPANDSLPMSDDCEQPIKARLFTVYLGNSTFNVHLFPYTLIQIGPEKYFTISMRPDGAMVVTATLVDRDGKVLVDFDENGFRVNSNNIFYKERKDEHSLAVFDQRKNKVLSVRFNNKNYMTISAIVNYRDKVIVHADEAISINRMIFDHSCIGGFGGGILIR